MSQVTLTDEDITAALKAVVEEAGFDYVYPPAAARMARADKWYYLYSRKHRSRYRDEHGGCIVGRFLDRVLGPDLWNPRLERKDAIDVLAPVLDISVFAMAGLHAAQKKQDRAGSYGQALNAYREQLTAPL